MQRGAHCSAGLSTLHYTSCCGAGAITGGSGGTGITSGDVIRQLRSLQKNKRIAGGWPKTAWASCRCSRLLPLLSLPPPPPPSPLLPFSPSLFAAIVLRIDSGGGDALASDLMWREVQELGKTKPMAKAEVP